MLTYTNKRNKQVILSVARHAYTRFCERYPIAFGHTPQKGKLVDIFENLFNSANRVTKLNGKEKVRAKRHGGETTYFRTCGFTFVVKNATIVTVELSDKGKRHLNKTA